MFRPVRVVMYLVVYRMMHHPMVMYRMVYSMMSRRMMFLCAGKAAQTDEKGRCKQNLLHDVVLLVLVYFI